jgi:hypothetical protein
MIERFWVMALCVLALPLSAHAMMRPKTDAELCKSSDLVARVVVADVGRKKVSDVSTPYGGTVVSYEVALDVVEVAKGDKAIKRVKTFGREQSVAIPGVRRTGTTRASVSSCFWPAKTTVVTRRPGGMRWRVTLRNPGARSSRHAARTVIEAARTMRASLWPRGAVVCDR